MIRICKMGTMSKCMLSLFTILLLYCFVFNPPFRFLSVGLTKFMYILSFPFFISPSINKKYCSRFSSVTLLLVLFVLYSFFVHLLFSSEASFVLKNIFLVFESFFTAYVIAHYLVSYYQDRADLMILWTSIIACVITIILIIKPDLNASAREMFVMLDDERLQNIAIFRGFGIADDLLFTYPIALSIGLCICLQYVRKNVLYLGLVFLFLVGIFFNARIGMVPISIYLMYVVFKERKISFLLILSITIIVLIFILFNSNILDEHEVTIRWLKEGFMEVSSLLSGEEQTTGTFGNLSRMIIIPDTFLGFMLGTGKDIYLANDSSDIGYILQLNYGGIIYVLFFFFVVLKLYKIIRKNNLPQNRWFNIVFIGTFLICNIKGNFFATHSGVRMLMLLFFVYVILNNATNYQER